MRTLILTAFFVLVSTLTGSPVFAQTGDGITPAEESVCDPLKGAGVTKGLYGLCIAYCEAEARSQNVLDNYNRRRGETDPEMPCAEPPVASCPCWSADTLQAARDSGLTPACTFGAVDEAIYFDISLLPVVSYEAFGVNSSTCGYIFDPDLSTDPTEGTIELSIGVKPAEEGACRADIESLCP